jgi:rhodanese-related sulfurtransferase
MEKLDELVKSYDLDYFLAGSYKMSFDQMMDLHKKDEVFVIDARTAKEYTLVNFDFGVNIPLNEIPDRLDEIPDDKPIAIFCFSGTRATFGSMYLQAKGYDVKVVPGSISDFAGNITCGYVNKYFVEEAE